MSPGRRPSCRSMAFCKFGEAVRALGNWLAAVARRAARHVRLHSIIISVPAVTDMEPPILFPTATQLVNVASREHRQTRYEEAARRHDVGATITRISAELGADLKAIHDWLLLGYASLWQQRSGDGTLYPFKPFLGRR